MPGLNSNLTAAERIICAIDTSDDDKATQLAETAVGAGAWVVKIGLEYSTATSWKECSELADAYGLEWVADAKLKDIPNTVAGAVNNLASLDKPPVGITIHTPTGIESLQAAQKIATEADIMILGVTHLTSIGPDETLLYNHDHSSRVVGREAARAIAGGIGGIVCSGLEVGLIKGNDKFNRLFTMIPGTRSAGADKADQARVVTPAEAVVSGADLLVIGRQISGATDPAEAYAAVVEEIASALEQVA